MSVKDQALQLPHNEKLELANALWEDLRREGTEFESPAWHGEVLAGRERAIDEGTAGFLTVDEARAEIMRKREG